MIEEFLSLNWRITGPHELEHGPDFIPEEEIERSYIFSSLRDKFLKKGDSKVVTPKPVSVVVQKQYPGKSYRLKCQEKSFLTTAEQSKCFNALQIMQSGKKGLSPIDKACIELYNNVQDQIIAENARYQELAKKRFLARKTEGGFSKHYKNYAQQIFGEQMKRCKDYAQFYKEIDMLSYSYSEDHTPIEMNHLKCLLELGSLAKFSKPSLIKPYFIASNKMPNVFETYNSNLPVSKDVNAMNLAQNEDVDIVISSSVLKRLLNFTETNCKWDIPVEVKEIPVRKPDGSEGTKTVVFIDKPLPNRNPTTMEITERCIKWGLKSNLCYLEGVKYGNVESPLNTVYNEPLRNTKKKKRKKEQDPKPDLTGVANENGPECNFKEGSFLENEKHEPKKLKLDTENVTAKTLSITEPLQTINNLKSADETEINLISVAANKKDLEENKEEEPEPEKQKLESNTENVNNEGKEENESLAKQNPVKLQHNASYRLWNLGQVHDNDQSELIKQRFRTKDIKVIVRCKLDACELVNNSVLQPLIIYPKIEYQPEFGGSVPSKSEIVKQWASLHFRPYSQLYRVRLTPITKEVLMVENCTIEKIKKEAQNFHKYKPSLGLGVLYKIFIELSKLTKGSYMLHHLPKHGAFVALLESTQEEKCTYNLHNEYDVSKWQINPKFEKIWCPIDVNLLLPKHLAVEQMPGLFPPALNKKPVRQVWTKGMKRKGIKKKGKKKKKPQNSTENKDCGNAT